MKYQSMVLGNYTAWDQGVWTVSAESTTGSERSLARHDIAALAYCYWIERGYAYGSPEEDWLRAEVELRARNSSPTAAMQVDLKSNSLALAAGA